jgi:phosphohistidine swiveling domain-containing protein
MALRETAKYLFTKEYLLLRDTLELLEQKTGLTNGDIYFLYPRELAALVAAPSAMHHLIRARRQSFKNYEELDMPHVIREFDVDRITLASDSEVDFIEAKGKFLAEGPSVEGRIVNLDEWPILEEASDLMRQYNIQGIAVVLVSTQMNLSHDPFIARAAGLVIENAGIVAHGAQRARELGKGAIGGIKARQLKTGMKVYFDPQNQLIRKC